LLLSSVPPEPEIDAWPAFPKSTFGKRLLSPVDDDSTLQPKAILTVVVAADSEGTVVAKASVEILSLDEP
jgi:hypothetical protein